MHGKASCGSVSLRAIICTGRLFADHPTLYNFVQIRSGSCYNVFVMVSAVCKHHEAMPDRIQMVEDECISPEPGKYLLRCRSVDAFEPALEPRTIKRVARAVATVLVAMKTIHAPIADTGKAWPHRCSLIILAISIIDECICRWIEVNNFL